jgi:thioredoxin 1
MILDLHDDNFQSSIAKGISLVDFWAPWCAPCKQLNPLIEKIATDNPDLIVGKVNIDRSPAIAQRFNILSVPTIIIFKNGDPYEQIVGSASEKHIMEKVDRTRK